MLCWVYNYSGNVCYRKLVLEQAPAYLKNKKTCKVRKAITQNIIDTIAARGGKFLRLAETEGAMSWDIAPKPIVFAKVKQCLMDISSRLLSTSSGPQRVRFQLPIAPPTASGLPGGSLREEASTSEINRRLRALLDSPPAHAFDQQNTSRESPLSPRSSSRVPLTLPSLPNDGAVPTMGPQQILALLQAIADRRDATTQQLFLEHQRLDLLVRTRMAISQQHRLLGDTSLRNLLGNLAPPRHPPITSFPSSIQQTLQLVRNPEDVSQIRANLFTARPE